MSDGARRTALLLGIVTVAAGLASISVLSSRQVLRSSGNSTEESLKTVSDTLDDCYSKLKDMQDKLTKIGPAPHRA